MKVDSKDSKSTLDRAVFAVRSDAPPSDALAEARARGEQRLFGDVELAQPEAPMRGCDDIQAHLAAYRRGSLKAPRALLVRNHLVECANCREVWNRRGALRLASVPWNHSPNVKALPARQTRPLWAALAAAVAFCVAIVVWRLSYQVIPPGQRATVQAVNGALYRLDGATVERLAPGSTLTEGQRVRAGNSAQSLLRLADGSVVELGERAEFSVAMRDSDTTLQLNRGQIIVQAAKRSSGHLYVTTPDCRVAVTGTVFSVMASLMGSRVSVIHGEVQVSPAESPKKILHRGDQLTTSDALTPVPIEEEVAWSRNLDKHLALLHEMSELRRQWDGVRVPGLRYETKFAALVPEDSVAFAALPNYGEALMDGYRLLLSRLAESPVLQNWWDQSDLGQHGEELGLSLDKLHNLSGFLGDEVVLSAALGSPSEHLLLLAEVKRPGLAEMLASEFATLKGDSPPPKLVDERAVISGALRGFSGSVVLVTPQFAAFSPTPDAITDLVSRLGSGQESGFISTPLGEQVATAYANGAGLFVAADLELISAAHASAQSNSGAQDALRLLQFERKTIAGQTFNSGVLAFAGPRRGVGSWLAAPAPMGSLDFLTSQTSAAAAFVVKRPAEVFDDILRLLPSTMEARSKLSAIESEFDLRFREDIADALGAELTVALDGPLLPLPSWKLVLEVQDAERLERAFEAFARRIDQELRKQGKGAVQFEHERVGNHTYHRVSALDTRFPFEANYAFVDGYLVMTPSRALLSRALEAHARGDSLARSSRFTSLLPRDGRESLSGLVFQDLLSIIPITLSAKEGTMTLEQRQGLQQLLSDAKPSLVGFYGEEDRIEMTAIGDLFPLAPEALALPGLIRHIFPEAVNIAKQ